MAIKTLRELVDARVGSQAGLRTRLQAAGHTISKQTINGWMARSQVSVRMCKPVHEVTGISLRVMRPADWRRYWPEAPATNVALHRLQPAGTGSSTTARK